MPHEEPSTTASPAASIAALIRVARPNQWVKGAFVVIGPLYSLSLSTTSQIISVLGAMLAFNFAASACYVVNDLQDAEADRAHPRKRYRPIASGMISPVAAMVYASMLILTSAASLFLVYIGYRLDHRIDPTTRLPIDPETALPWLAICIGLYIVNVLVYSIWTKNIVVADVIGLSLGFVLRVLGGCAAVMVVPSSGLLNVTFFVAMFLAFGKRLGERRVMGRNVSQAREVQSAYTEELLRMFVVVTGVATLLTYSGYVQAQADKYRYGFNLLWLTMLPATYALLRCIVLLEKGLYDDPTELASRDRPFRIAAFSFVAITAALLWQFRGSGKGF